ncbi:protein LURP-one-related 11-like [Cynara cardunculus var. scolymus]|uniref:Initiation factor 2B-related protein n=1 Tax=Cynara cardunculus var. scolymus TaxID=59895 RepID=A0A103XR75_CYNCS|nr:protein LURP-one-related 11-like [Cynara cardunculus var. scolymus]KVH95404.1 Initiation factor 2B-related protein [Cynara cardunculus var. scolymus]
MAKIYPSIPSSSSSSFCSNERETYTIWMKSLVMNSNGYTVYDSNGNVVFRIDNYDNKNSSEVYLMDLRGNIVCTILRKKLLRLGLWDCCHSNDSCRPWFKVGKAFNFFKNDSVYDVLVGTNEARNDSSLNHRMEGSVHGLEFKITDGAGRVRAEVQRKRSSSGVVLGEDVLCVTVEPGVNHIFVLALVAIQGLIHRKM